VPQPAALGLKQGFVVDGKPLPLAEYRGRPGHHEVSAA
jgi:hypothetical protein